MTTHTASRTTSSTDKKWYRAEHRLIALLVVLALFQLGVWPGVLFYAVAFVGLGISLLVAVVFWLIEGARALEADAAVSSRMDLSRADITNALHRLV